MFSRVVTEFWERRFSTGTLVSDDGTFTLVIDPQLSADSGAALLTARDGRSRVALTPEVAETSGLDAGADSVAEVHSRLGSVGIALDDAAELHYLPEDGRDALLAENAPAQVRPLTAADADRFATFRSACSAEDLDEAEVALDDWDVLGVVAGDALVAAASAYLWEGSRIADLGVLTHPDHRGQGHARMLVCAFSRRLLATDYEPQYRCDPGNEASAAVARSAGLAWFGTWTTADG